MVVEVKPTTKNYWPGRFALDLEIPAPGIVDQRAISDSISIERQLRRRICMIEKTSIAICVTMTTSSPFGEQSRQQSGLFRLDPHDLFD